MLPPLVDRAVNFAKAMAAWTASGFSLASADVVAVRAKECEGCDQWNPKGYGGLGECKHCGCSGVKIHLATSSCPLGKWHAVDNS